MTSDQRTARLLDGEATARILRDNGIRLTSRQCGALERYVAELRERNRSLNLLSRGDLEHIWRRHILHSLAPLAVVSLPGAGVYIDIGTGGGLPGIPLAIALPDASFVLCDSVGKKIRAVASMIESLGLANVRARAVRVEEWTEGRGTADAVLARAVTRLDTLASWAHALLRDPARGSLYAWKGGDLAAEVRAAGRKRFVRSVEVRPLALTGEPYFVEEEKQIAHVRFHAAR